jgi:hypothetical protein
MLSPMSKKSATAALRTDYWQRRIQAAHTAAQNLPEGLPRTAALKAAALLREAANMFEALKPTKR